MATQTPRPGENRTKPGRLTGVTPNSSLSGTPQECRQQLVHHNATNAATKNITQDAHLKIVHKTESSKNKNSMQLDVNIFISR
jgi:hypothetical protein